MAFDSLEIVPLRTGVGRGLDNGDQVQMYYEGRLTDGTLFDRNYDFATFTPVTGRTPFSLEIGSGQVIQGWEQALPDLAMGDIAELRIPASLGYGSVARSSIPANSDLIFTVMPVEVNGVDLTYADLGLQIPAAPELQRVDGVVVAGSERSTADATPTLEFGAAKGSTVTVFRDGVAVGEATEEGDDTGRFVFTSSALADGRHGFSAQANFLDPASIAPLAPLKGAISQPFSLVLNTQVVPPTVPPVVSPVVPPVVPPVDPLIEGGTPVATTPRFEPESQRGRYSEGDPLINRVRTDLPAGTEVAWRLSGRGINAGDFSEGGLEGQTTVRPNGLLVVRHRVAEDFAPEGVETATLQLLPSGGATRREDGVTVARAQILDTSRELPPAALTPGELPSGYDPSDPWASVPFHFFAVPSPLA